VKKKDRFLGDDEEKGISRRGFLKGGLTGAAALGLSALSTDSKAVEEKRASRKRSHTWMIDAFCHIMPPKYAAALGKVSKGRPVYLIGRHGLSPQPTMIDIEARLRMMDRYEGYVQILNISLPPPEDVAGPKEAVELAKIANDSLAELVYKYPDRFIAATACLPLNDMDAAMKELDRAIKELKFRGVQITTTIMDKPLDSPEFQPLFEKMHAYNLPIQLHPRTMKGGTRFLDEANVPKDLIGFWAQTPYNWPFETTIAMGRLVFSGIFEKYPNLKILTHHLGGVSPYHMNRVTYFMEGAEMRFGVDMMPKGNFTKRWADYYRMFYNDTACYGATDTLMCGVNFCGADHLLFATDVPYDSTGGARLIRETIGSVEDMDIPEADRKKIFEDNARKLFRLPI
jgi:predicted TIM-barrel fold metal-dependent hydrolase